MIPVEYQMGTNKHYQDVREELRAAPRRWLVTGGSGFIGSHLVEELLELDQHVTVMDLRPTQFIDARLLLGDIDGQDEEDLRWLERAFDGGVDVVLHQAATSSVSDCEHNLFWSTTNNVRPFLKLLHVAKKKSPHCRVVYASSSAVYGDLVDEDELGHDERDPVGATSIYGASKVANEAHASAFGSSLVTTGLRYFNVFGERQALKGGAVMPTWISRMLDDEDCFYYGESTHTRDYVHVSDIVQANLLAGALLSSTGSMVFNVGSGHSIPLSTLFELLLDSVSSITGKRPRSQLRRLDARPGDIGTSACRIDYATRILGYRPQLSLLEGISRTVRWYAENKS